MYDSDAPGRSPDEEHERRRQAPSHDSSSQDLTGVSFVELDGIENLRAAKHFTATIVDTVREALLVLDLDFRVTAANESFYRTYDATPGETLGKSIYQVAKGQWNRPELRKLLEDVLPEKKSMRDFEIHYDTEATGERSMVLRARQLDEHELILLAIEDVTERRQSERELRRAQQRFDAFVENAKEYAIFTMDTDATITRWNSGAERMLGWSEKEIIGRTGAVVFTQEDRAAGVPEQELETARRRGHSRDDRWHVRKGGSRFWATGSMVALRDEHGTVLGLIKIIRDDTQQREAEQEREALLRELRQLNETLEQRVAERTRQVRELASTLTVAEQEERRRISQILHDDLQQRLFGVRKMLDSAKKAVEKGRLDEVLETISRGDDWIERSVAITRNLTVDLSPPILKSDRLSDTLEWLAFRMHDLHGLQVEIVAEPLFRMPDKARRMLLLQVLRELLFNVVKHADTGQATVELRRTDHLVRVRVTDEGRGFDVDAGRSAEVGGFGLFSIRERLLLFGGSMNIESAPGKGTIVTIDLPLGPE